MGLTNKDAHSGAELALGGAYDPGVGMNLRRLIMSVTLAPWGLSNPMLKPWVITVVIVVVITWGAAADVIGTVVGVLELMAMLCAGEVVQQRRTAT
ncbi:hypothetical protein OHS71_12790 [Streptomyces sp. NBC_00377]|uniref:hypothetical protein n=1 Tax=unclassified Streptomyces TaxID=2593676 RepID=UPI002E22A058|nr:MULTISPECIES: hypothetical protein [unclassified Streptomyces]